MASLVVGPGNKINRLSASAEAAAPTYPADDAAGGVENLAKPMMERDFSSYAAAARRHCAVPQNEAQCGSNMAKRAWQLRWPQPIDGGRGGGFS